MPIEHSREYSYVVVGLSLGLVPADVAELVETEGPDI